MILDRATKRKLQFNLRNQAKPKELQQLDWITDDMKHLKDTSKAEIELLGARIAKKLLKSNLQCIKGVYSWSEEQDLAIANPHIETQIDQNTIKKTEEKPKIPDKIEKKPHIAETKDNFFDDDGFDEVSEAGGKQGIRSEASPERQQPHKEPQKLPLSASKEEKGNDFFDDEDGFDEIQEQNNSKEHKGELNPIPEESQKVHDNHIELDKQNDIIVQEEQKQNESILSDKSTSSVVSRRSTIFESKAYHISAYKNMDEKKVLLKLFVKGEKIPIDELKIEDPDVEDEDKLAQKARTELRECKLIKNQEGDVLIELREDPENIPKDSIGLDLNFNASSLADKIGIYASYVKERPTPIYKQLLKDDYWWYISEYDEYECYKVSVVKVHEADNSEEYKDWNFTGIKLEEGMTKERYKDILSKFDFNWEIMKIFELGSPDLEGSGAEQATEEDEEIEPPLVLETKKDLDEEAGEEEEEDPFGVADKGPKYEVVVERSREEDNIVDVISVNLKSREETDRRKLKCVFSEDAKPGENDKKIDYIKKSWEAHPKSGKLFQKELPEDVDEDYNEEDSTIF